MLTTEEQAKIRLCPVKIAPVIAAGLRGDHGLLALGELIGLQSNDSETALKNATCCVATDCMAWRWHQHGKPAEYVKNVPTPDMVRELFRQGYEPDPNHQGAYRKVMTPEQLPLGYCGLAGKASL